MAQRSARAQKDRYLHVTAFSAGNRSLMCRFPFGASHHRRAFNKDRYLHLTILATEKKLRQISFIEF